jgi:inhibitor of KinA sporulation pathway (predicted exonuclease)
VYDFECQCTENNNPQLKFNEIIEFPVVVVDVKQQKIVAEFHTYVKPVVEPKLTPFCTQLTGIQQSQVDSGVTIQ